MLDFLGRRSVNIVIQAGIVGLFLAGMEILLSAYLVKLLSLIGIGQPGGGILHSLLGGLDDPMLVLVGFVLVTILRSLLHIAKGYCAVSANELFINRLRLLCISSTLQKIGPRHNPSRVYSLVSDVFLKSALSFYGAAHSVPLVAQGLLLFAFLLSLSIYLSFVGFSFVVVAGVFVVLIQRKIASVVRPLSDINDRLYKSLKRILENLLLIRFCKLENFENKNVSNILINYLKRIRKSNALSLFSENIPTLLGSVVIAVLFIMQLSEHTIAPELFLAFVYLFVRFVQCLSQVVSFASLSVMNYPYFIAAYRYYQELPQDKILGFDKALLEECLIVNTPNEKQGNMDHIELFPSLSDAPIIEANSLCYGYEDNKYIFNQLSFKISSGSQCVIVGPSGVGKSTLLNLIVGELQPLNGEVSINGMQSSRFFDLHSHDAAYAGPEPLLFEGALRDNLLYGLNRIVTDDEIKAVLKSLGLGDWLSTFGGDLTIPLGPEGFATSSGQAQRLSIARAIIRKPKLLILDEVTANLDLASEKLVLDLLEDLKVYTTVIIVTHSYAMMQNADLVLNLDTSRTVRIETR